MITIVEGLFYRFPHEPILEVQHPTMLTIWGKCRSLVDQGGVMAPLLNDDRPRQNALCEQQVEDIRCGEANPFLTVDSLRWFGEPMSEAILEAREGKIGCSRLDAHYHLDVIRRLPQDWSWVVVHPTAFKDQQAAMLRRLVGLIASPNEIERLMKERGTSLYDTQLWLKNDLLARFTHIWVSADGQVESTTQPIWRGGKVVHKPIYGPAADIHVRSLMPATVSAPVA